MRKNSKETHWASLFIDRKTTVHFDSFGIEYIPHKKLIKIKDESITHNILRIQDKDFIFVDFVISLFIEYMLVGKTSANFFSLNDYKKNGRIICVSILRINTTSLEFRLKNRWNKKLYFTRKEI